MPLKILNSLTPINTHLIYHSPSLSPLSLSLVFFHRPTVALSLTVSQPPPYPSPLFIFFLGWRHNPGFPSDLPLSILSSSTPQALPLSPFFLLPCAKTEDPLSLLLSMDTPWFELRHGPTKMCSALGCADRTAPQSHRRGRPRMQHPTMSPLSALRLACRA
jgi:hypothetical protein